MIFSKKSQTATEYLIILAVVIVIALIVIGVLGGIPSIGGGASKSAKLADLTTRKIGISNYAFQDNFSIFLLKNNLPSTVSIKSLWIDGSPCALSGLTFPLQLRGGMDRKITCTNWDVDDSEFQNLIVEYKDTSVDALYTTADSGTTVEDFKGISLTDCWPGAYSAPQDICTCADLNKTRTQMSGNFVLTSNIDLGDSSCSAFSSWDPIGTSGDRFNGIFDGGGNSIFNLDVDSSTTGSGLFGHINGATISNLNLVNIDVSGAASTGGLVGFSVQYIGTIISNINVSGDVSGTSTRVGGVVGYAFDQINNVYFSGTVSGTSHVGGLVGYGGYVDVDNSFVEGAITSTTGYAGGLMGGGYCPFYASSLSTAVVSTTSGTAAGIHGYEPGCGWNTVSSTYWYNNSDDAFFDVGYDTAGSGANYDHPQMDLCSNSDCSDYYSVLGWTP